MTSGIRITDLDVTTVAMPLRGRALHSDGVEASHHVRHLIEMRTDEGVTGLGEIGSRVQASAIKAAARSIAGTDPFNLEGLRLRVQSDKFYRMEVASLAAGLQMAALDIQGKVTGRAVCEVLGGRVRDHVPVIAYAFRTRGVDGAPDRVADHELVEDVQEQVAVHGFRSVKLKAGAVPPDRDISATLALRDALPGHRLRLDPNAAWSVTVAMRAARRLRDCDLEWFEDPVLGIPAMSRLARRLDVPLATNMCCIQPREFSAAVSSQAIDVMLLDLWYLGGPWSAKMMASTCAAFGIDVGLHSGGGGYETGVGQAAQLHLAASLPSLVHDADTGYMLLLDDVLKGGRLPVKDGCFAVPGGPGLGVELDPDQVGRYADAYLAGAAGGGEAAYPSYPIW